MESKEDLINYALHSEEGRSELSKELAKSGSYSEEYWKNLLDKNHRYDIILHSIYPEYKLPAIAHTA